LALNHEDAVTEVMIILDCSNPNTNNTGSFKALMMGYKKELLALLNKS